MTQSERVAASVMTLSNAGESAARIAVRLGISVRRVYQLRPSAPREKKPYAASRGRVRALPVGAGLQVSFG
ncbi:hypothetical protein AA23498_3587 [Acetobacter nitrogenifigens DSM 23921 = NBRC 105050]|uniref:Resolvase HTH domain-containing protein n=1 Tax=Acetobacter nitrogenifigens DSM 23921 = NBRC 105050 TaxID=1120919 RepID=A0A511XDZ6_9PROT|nr:hypothetical protein [Acetobacter nitrogenifigens]GBQ99896.1 hypothetical protein AA23498_3587 [Acetobacter nitrogenifigens DSM 23921 = NBRC 105050]GEN61184.1 hypothetical protein ANI02nite_30680 [Acetobacter nitrogenifigens DSM 23921 = NBRC 105050]